MDTLAKILWLTTNAYSFSIDANQHRAYHEAIADSDLVTDLRREDPALADECVRVDCVIAVYCYPSNSVGSYRIVHHDLALAIDRLFEASKSEVAARMREMKAAADASS